MNKFIIFITAALTLCSCGMQKKLIRQQKQLDIAYKSLDSLNNILALKAAKQEIKQLQDNSRIIITKYTKLDTTGNQAVDYTVEIKKEVEASSRTENEIVLNEASSAIIETNIEDNSQLQSTEEFDAPPAVAALSKIKAIIAMVLIGYIAYIIRKACS